MSKKEFKSRSNRLIGAASGKFSINALFELLSDKHLEVMVRGSLGFFNLRVLGMAAQYIFILLVSHWYGAKILGIYSISIAALRIAMLVSRMGLDNALVKFVAQYAAEDRWDQVKRIYSMAIRIAVPCGLVASAVLFILAPVLANILKKPDLAITFRLTALFVLPDALMYLNAAGLRGLKRIKEYSFLLNVAQFLFAVIVLAAGKSLLARNYAPITAYAAGTVAAAVISFWFGTRQWRLRKEKSANDGIKAGGLMKVAFPMLLSGSYSLFLAWTGTMVLGFFRPVEEAGVYEVVIKVAALITFTLTAINSIAASQFSETHAVGDMEGFRKVASHSKRLIFWSTFPVGLVIFLFPSAIISLFGNSISSVGSGPLALMIMVFGYLVNAVSGPVGTILNMTGHEVVYQNILLAAAVINILLCVLLIPQFGIYGAAFASSVSMTTWNLLSVYYVKKKFNVLTLYIPFLNKE
jgi:O-antigen/teichoic acid export membrane protein